MGFLAVLAQLVLCLLAADFSSGFFHWLEDTYLVPGRSALLDRLVVEPNIEHHRRPGRMRDNNYVETNAVTHGLAIGFALILGAFHVHAWQPYVALFLAAFANQVHQWAHRSDAPSFVRALQRTGIFLSPAHHGVHHKSPYAIRHCTVTNYLNPVLDGLRFWRALEWALARIGLNVARATAARGGF